MGASLASAFLVPADEVFLFTGSGKLYIDIFIRENLTEVM
jgi:hypothetical protein